MREDSGLDVLFEQFMHNLFSCGSGFLVQVDSHKLLTGYSVCLR